MGQYFMKGYPGISERLKKTYELEMRNFEKSLGNVAKTRGEKLQGIINKNSQTEFGRDYNFEDVKDIESFRSNVPITTYEDYEGYVARIAEGQQKILTDEKIFLLEPTSGSTSASKFIPYTKSLIGEFQAGIFPWLNSVMEEFPETMNGSLYWSVTPATHKNEKTSGGITIGFGDDASYFTEDQGRILSQLSAVPFDIANITEVDEFKSQTLAYLLGDKNLSFVSTWSPTFLPVLLSTFEKNPEDILRRIGTPRSKELEDILNNSNSRGETYSQIWPNLRVVSSWTEGNAAIYVPELKGMFPQATVQGKGLISTEGFTSFPYSPAGGNILSVNSHFFEFKDPNGNKVFLADETSQGEKYEVIISTGGGLYRYNTQDIVEVTGHYKGCPTLKFEGRNNNVSDLFGEKLNELHVRRVLEKSFDQKGIKPSFFMMAPDNSESHRSYALFVESNMSNIDAVNLTSEIDEGLQENYHYNYCRKLGQLGPLKLFKIDSSEVSPEEIYLTENQKEGKRLGNIKPATLDSRIGWSKAFQGRFIN